MDPAASAFKKDQKQEVKQEPQKAQQPKAKAKAQASSGSQLLGGFQASVREGADPKGTSPAGRLRLNTSPATAFLEVILKRLQRPASIEDTRLERQDIVLLPGHGLPAAQATYRACSWGVTSLLAMAGQDFYYQRWPGSLAR